MIKFISSNQRKIENYTLFLSKFGVRFEPINVDLTEIQTDNSKDLAIAKAKEAFVKIKEPLFINDAGWSIPALKGFPGPYMKYVNQWFTSEDFLRLMNGIDDRRIILSDYFACVDKDGKATVFEAEYNASIINQPIGVGSAIDRITKFDLVDKPISEFTNEDRQQIFGQNQVWSDLAQWIKSNTI